MTTDEPSARPFRIPEWTLADRLRKVRRDAHLSQEAFASILGVKPTTLSAWESGRAQPERLLSVAGVIEAEFGVPAVWLLGLADRPRPTDYVAAMPVQRRQATHRTTCVA